MLWDFLLVVYDTNLCFQFLVNHSDMLVVASEDREQNVGQEHDSDVIRMMIEAAKKYLLSKD